MNFSQSFAATPVAAAVCVLVVLAASASRAQGVATDVQLAPVTVTGAGQRSGLAPNLPSSTASKTAEDLRDQNLFNPEDALKYVPNTSIRKRYIGDRNSMIGGRSFGTLQPSRGLAYVDGYLISNFLGRFDGPRWNMVTPEAISRVDVLYGPFSAIYPGNSIGTTVAITERVPREFEASARVTGYRQWFDQYEHADKYDGNQLSAYLGSRLDSGLWYSASINHQNSTSQPMTYYTLPVTAGTGGTRVTGIRYDTDMKGVPRAILGAGVGGGSVDHTVQDTVKLKVGYNLTPELEARAMLGLWSNDTHNSNRSFLRDAAGNTVWSGQVTDGTNSFNIAPSAFAPSLRDEQHRHTGLTLKTKHATGWNGSVVYSNYRIVRDVIRLANVSQDQAANGGAGTATRRDGTGWNTFEVQAAYKPIEGDFTGGRHALTLGVHRNGYVADSPTINLSDWRDASSETGLSNAYAGRTEVTALYAQDAWTLNEAFTLTWGLRAERFKTFDGVQQSNNIATCTPAVYVACTPAGARFNMTAQYPERQLSATSPKASLAWALPGRDLVLKLSFGRGVRFPNVEELYNSSFSGSALSLSDPELKAERSNALELSAEKDWGLDRLRVSLFHDDVRDAILRQTDVTVTPTVTRISNVDRVKTTGIEFAWLAQDWLFKGLNIDANAAFTRSKVAANDKDPLSVGKYWLRVPKVRANLLAAYRPNSEWMASLGLRHSGRTYNDVYNADVNPNVYGGVSSFTFVDVRGSYKINPKVELALGIDNVADKRVFHAHPYPGRTLFLELRANY